MTPQQRKQVCRAVRAWIRAEYEFRCGQQAYCGDTGEWFNQASNELRRALTGKSDLGKAGVVLGKTSVNRLKLRPRMRIKNGK